MFLKNVSFVIIAYNIRYKLNFDPLILQYLCGQSIVHLSFTSRWFGNYMLTRQVLR